uniref:Uncharacterized protein n=1 Tax=Oryza rufipogon TaxID=4529 RepID=A0A0E0P9N9_ORYRU
MRMWWRWSTVPRRRARPRTEQVCLPEGAIDVLFSYALEGTLTRARARVHQANRHTTMSCSSLSSFTSASSTSLRGSHRWPFLKAHLHRSKWDEPTSPRYRALASRIKFLRGAEEEPFSLYVIAVGERENKERERGTTGRSKRRSVHERMYEARRAEAEKIGQQTFLPYSRG